MSDIKSTAKTGFANEITLLLESGANGLTQAELARRLKISPGTISGWKKCFAAPEPKDFKLLISVLKEKFLVNEDTIAALSVAWRRFKGMPSKVRKNSPHAPTQTLVNLPPYWNIFFDWTERLPLISEILESGSPAPRVALFGLPGIGKTALARAYIEKYRNDYTLVAWINAREETSKQAAIADIGARLGWELSSSPRAACREVLGRLGEVPGNILLIYDDEKDKDTFREYQPPHESVRIIVTTNSQDWGAGTQPLSITEWTKDIGARYLVSRVPRLSHQSDAAAALSSTLYHLPLALEHAATYCEECKVDFVAYNESFKSLGLEILGDPDFVALDYQRAREVRHERTVAGTLELALRQASRSDGAETLLNYLSLLAVDPVPVSFFDKEAALFGKGAGSTPLSRTNKAIRALRQYSLVYDEQLPDPRNAEGIRTIRLHGLVRKIVAARMEDHERQQKSAHLIEAIIRAMPKEAYSDQNNWFEIRFYDPHARSLVHEETSMPAENTTAAIRLLNFLAEYRHGATNDYGAALKMFERALSLGASPEGQAGDEERQKAIAASHHGLAWVLATTAKYGLAMRHFIAALRSRLDVLGEDDADTAETLHRLGWLCVRRGHYRWAEAFLKKVLPIFDEMPDEAGVIKSAPLVTMGWLYQTWGDYEKAEHYASQVARIENRHGATNTVVSTSLYTLATIQSHLGSYEASEKNFTRALELRRKMYQAPHDDIANTLSGFGVLRTRQGRRDEAETCFEEAVLAYKTLGLTQHPRYASALAGRVELMLVRGLPEEAESLALESLAIREGIKSSGHTERAQSQWILSRAILAHAVISPERKAMAIDLLHRAIDTLERRVLPSHIWLKGAKETLASLDVPFPRSGAEAKSGRNARLTGKRGA
jgi:tetratricopeptide (TPR) repeat protein/transcriptional regulator with XRE-family HTH domain